MEVSSQGSETGMLSEDDEARLADLRWHWAEAYTIDCTDGVWSARPVVEPTAGLSAGSEQELRRAIRSDYSDRRARRLQDGALHRSESCMTFRVTICRCRQSPISGSVCRIVRE
jgi:hypothetical protein